MTEIARVAQEMLNDLEDAGRRRILQETTPKRGMEVIRRGQVLVNFSSNDYFGLSRHPKVVEAAAQALERYGAGSGASRLVTGNLPLTTTLEEKLADLRGTEAACLFGSGYLANIGSISALMYRNDLILADKWVHACILDGARLSGARLMRFRHNDMAHLEELLERHREYFDNCLIVTDSIFSMDGDLAPVGELSLLARNHDAWLMTDDAHGWGTDGKALDAKAHQVDIQMGTLSKAAGTYGGYVCAKQPVIDLLKSSARSLVFSTALPPAVLASSLAALRIIEKDDAVRARPLALAQQFTEALALPKAESPIVPVILGDNERAMRAAEALQAEGLLVAAIRPPTVPEGTARLRVSFSAAHSDAEVERLIETIRRVVFDAGLVPAPSAVKGELEAA